MSRAGNVKNTYKREKSVFFQKEMINVICYVAHRVVSYNENMYGNLPSGIFGDSDHKKFETAQ